MDILKSLGFNTDLDANPLSLGQGLPKEGNSHLVSYIDLGSHSGHQNNRLTIG